MGEAEKKKPPEGGFSFKPDDRAPDGIGLLPQGMFSEFSAIQVSGGGPNF
jgi:hypothetical protein